MIDDDEWLPDADAADAGDTNLSPEQGTCRSSAADNRKSRKRSYHDGDDDADDEDQLRSFYEEASMNKNVGSLRRSTSLGAMSHQSSNKSTTLSLGELSRMDENHHLSQSSHHEEEEERQKRLLAKRANRKSGIKKETVWNFTEKQRTRMKLWQRFKNRKAIDVSQEEDVGGSMEYLVRKRLGEQAERKRLKLIAKERDEKRKIKLEEEASEFSGYDGMQKDKAVEKDDGDDDGIWNYLDQGLVNMPLAHAEKLPYYVYMKAKCDDNDGRSDCADEAPQPVKKRKYTRKQGRKQPLSRPNTTLEQLDIVPRSFPLHLNQVHGKGTDLGPERMVFSHGKNAVRLWTRMVANGLMVDDFQNSQGMVNMNDSGKDKSDNDSMSNVSSSSSSSSESSVHSYHPEGVHSQLTYGTTSVVAMKDGDDNCLMNNGLASKQTPLFRLMAMVHKLPRSTNRTIFLLRVAQDIGIHLRIWEDELARYVDYKDNNGECNSNDHENEFFPPIERWAIKSFLGVDGSMASPPSWASDPTVLTHYDLFEKKIRVVRSPLLTRLRRWIKMKQKMLNESDSIGNKTNHASCQKQIDSESNLMSMSFVDRVDTEQSVYESSAHGEECDESKTILKKDHSSGEEGGEGDIDETIDVRTTAAVDESPKRTCLLQLQTTPDLGAEDKYAKIIHESCIDSSHFDIALASFVDHLSSSKARLQQMQELNSSHIEHRHALNSVKNEVNKWHEHTMLYLRLAETLCAVKEANFYRCGKAFPQSAPLAKAVMASQSYIANCGGVGYGQMRKSWELHDENNSHSDSEASEEDTMESTMMSQNSSTIARSRQLRSIKLASRELARGKECLLHRHLATFTTIRITTAIALIADSLTPRAAELVSRACCPDSPDNRTPFDLVKNMITLIEDEGTLISAPKVGWDMRGKIIDETLVSVMQEAAAVFQMCTEKEPENVDHWSWFVATLLGMLCIAFGSTRDSIIHSNIKMECEPSERPQLQRYPDIRVNAADAMRQFINYAHSHDAPMFHLAIASMLEWNKAASLLHRPQELGFGLEVKRLHAYHTLRWATTTCSRNSIAKVRQLCDSDYLPRDALIDVLAGAIEHDPCDIERWNNLVIELGALDQVKNYDKCMHEKIIMAKEGKWWGAHRRVDWEDQFFHAPDVPAAKLEFVKDIVEICLPSNAFHSQQAKYVAAKQSIEAPPIPDPNECVGWIWNPLDDDAGVDPLSRMHVINIVTIHSKMPPIKLESTQKLVDPAKNESLAMSPYCKALCMKILVAGHLGVQTFVCDSVWWFAYNLWQSTQTTADVHMTGTRNQYADGLSWLATHGIDISLHLQRRLKRSEEA